MAAIAFAHRGFSAAEAENSMAAFQAAVDLGYRYLETDARVTADGVAIAFHDYALDRVTNHTGRLADLSWEIVSQARVYGRDPIPLLEDVLAAFPDRQFNVDVKSNTAIGPTLDAVRRTDSWRRVRLAAFSHSRLIALRNAAGPNVATGLSPAEITATAAGRPPRVGGTDRAAQVPAGYRWLRLVTPRFIETAHRAGMPVHVWTVNNPDQMVRLLDLGVDGIMTDRADVLRTILEERGDWAGG
jgi:glycerophosphoryl diester phosphodiesterase